MIFLSGARYEDGYNRGNPEGKWSHDMYGNGGGAGRRGGDNMVSRYRSLMEFFIYEINSY